MTTRITLKNGKEIALSFDPKLVCEPYRASRTAPTTYWVSSDGVHSVGDGSTPAAAWKAAAETLRARASR